MAQVSDLTGSFRLFRTRVLRELMPQCVSTVWPLPLISSAPLMLSHNVTQGQPLTQAGSSPFCTFEAGDEQVQSALLPQLMDASQAATGDATDPPFDGR